VSRVSWKLRPTETLKLEAIRILDAKYLSLSNGSKQRILAMMRVRLTDAQDEPKLDYASAIKATLQHQRMKSLFDGLHRAAVPFLYVSMMTPSPKDEDDETSEEMFEFDLVVGTWVDAKSKKFEDSLQSLEERASVLAATLTVALPNAMVRRLSRNELRDFVKTLFLPTEPDLPQLGSTSVVSTLGPFDERSPMAGQVESSPEFYVPNSAESGKTGILLGTVKSSGGEFHDFRLQLEDLKRHVAILGMSVDHDEPILCREQGRMRTVQIGALVDSYYDDNQEGPVVPSNLECLSMDPRTGLISWSPIQYVLRHRYNDMMLCIEMEKGHSITVTPNHSVFALIGGSIRAVDASKLRSGDYLAAPNMLPDPSHGLEAIDLIELLKSEEDIFLYNVPPKVFDRISIPDKRGLEQDRRLPIGHADILNADEASLVTIGYKGHRRKLPTVITVDEDLSRLFGYYAAEGSVNIKNKNRYSIYFTFGPNDADVIRDCQRILWEKFGLFPKTHPHRGNSVRLQFNHRILAQLLVSLVGRGAKSKRFPNIVLNSPTAVRRAFIKGWIVGDSGVTVSRGLMNDAAYAFLFDHCVASVSYWKPRDNTVIEGRRVHSLPAYHLRFPDAKKYLTDSAHLKRAPGHEPTYPMSHIPNPLSGVCSTRMIRRRISDSIVATIERRVTKLESYDGHGQIDAKHDGFYRFYSNRFLT
jgi:hypothetical protein